MSKYYFNENRLDTDQSNVKKKVKYIYKYINSSKPKKNFVNVKPYVANDNKKYQQVEEDAFDEMFKGLNLTMKRKSANSLKNFMFSKEKKKDNNDSVMRED